MKFKCVHTGQVYEYSTEHDIAEMLKHDEYLAITEEPAPKPVKQAKKKETE